MTKIQSILSAVRMVKSRNGYNFAIGLYGTPEAIHDAFMMLSGAGVTNGELLDVGGKTFAYIWAEEDSFQWFLAKWEIDTMANNGELPKMDKHTAQAFFADIWHRYDAIFDAMETEDFVPENGIADFTDCLGIGSEERPARLASCED